MPTRDAAGQARGATGGRAGELLLQRPGRLSRPKRVSGGGLEAATANDRQDEHHDDDDDEDGDKAHVASLPAGRGRRRTPVRA